MTTPIIAGIDVGTSKICTIIAEILDDGDFQILGFGVEPARGIKKGAVVNLDDASAAITNSVSKAERAAGIEIIEAFVSLAGSHVSSINSNGVAGISQNQWGIEQADIDRALDAAQAIAIPHGRKVVHVIPRGFIVDEQEGVRTPLGMHGFRLEVEAHIVTASTSTIQNLEKCIENSGIRVADWVLNPLASADLLLTDTERDMGVVLVDIGGGTTGLAIYINGNVWHTMVLPIGGNHISSDIAHGLRLPAQTAEEIKIEHGHARWRDIDASEALTITPFGAETPQRISRKDLAMIIEARVEEIFSLVLQEIKRSGYDGLLPAGIVITGGVAHLPGIRQVASDVLKLPARIAAPANLRGLSDALNQKPEYSTSIGLINWGVTQIMAAPDPETTRRQSGGGQGNSLWLWIKEILSRLIPANPD